MSMFADFYKEEFGWDCIQNEYGFIFYFIKGLECYVSALYIRPEYRSTIEAKKFFTQLKKIAKDRGCAFVTANIGAGPGRENLSSKIIRCYLSLGFKIANANNSQILLVYKLEGDNERRKDSRNS